MQVGPNVGAHTLGLFGVRPGGAERPAGPSESAQAVASIARGLSMRPPSAIAMEGVYADPRAPRPGQGPEPGIARRVIDVLSGVRDTTLEAVERSLRGRVEAELGRHLSEGESIHNLSEQDRTSLSDGLRRSAHAARVADVKLAIATMGAPGGASPVGEAWVAVTDENRDATPEELIDAFIGSQVERQLWWIQEVGRSAREGNLRDLADAHAAEEPFQERFGDVLRAHGEAEIEAMRAEMTASLKARVASGDYSVTPDPGGPHDLGVRLGGEAAAPAAEVGRPLYHVIRFG